MNQLSLKNLDIICCYEHKNASREITLDDIYDIAACITPKKARQILIDVINCKNIKQVLAI